MSAKDSILARVRANRLKDDAPLPEIDFEPMSFEDTVQQLSTVVGAVGGELIELKGKRQVAAKVRELYPEAEKIVCNVGGVKLSDDDGSKVDTPQELASVDLAVIQGDFAVAENGAVWVRNPDNRHRALYFLAENIVLVVKKDQIVSTMHEAYERVSFDEPGYGLFISGPSKTADIEQSLVIGAHGPKSGYLLLI